MRIRLVGMFATLFLFALLVTGCGSGEEKELPNIPDEAKQLAIDQVKQYDEVQDAYVGVEGDEISLAIVVQPGTSEETAKELGDNFARLVSSMAASLNDELKGTAKDNLGEIYNYYDLHVGVGTGPDDFIVQGAKVTGSNNITW